MWELLKKIEQKGWKPYGKSIAELTETEKNIRLLTSRPSGLWQFVCENNLNYSEDDSIYNVWIKHYAENDHESRYSYASPVWYIIESALCDEDKLEDFLLQNIKIGDI